MRYTVKKDINTGNVLVMRDNRVISEYCSFEDFNGRYHKSSWFKKSPNLVQTIREKFNKKGNA